MKRAAAVALICATLGGCGRSDETPRVDCGDSALTKKCNSILRSCEGRSFNFNPISGAPTENTGAVSSCFQNEFKPVCDVCKSVR